VFTHTPTRDLAHSEAAATGPRFVGRHGSVVATPHPHAFGDVDVLAPGAWALLLLFAVFGWTFSVAVIKTVAA